MVYYFDHIDLFDDKYIEMTQPLLPFERIAKVDRLRNSTDKKLSMLVYLLLMYGLRKEGIDVNSVEFDYNKHGKPYLRNMDKVYFNLSHCVSGAACVISSQEVGIDIQNVKPVNNRILNRVCSEEEIRIIKNAGNTDKEFTRYWTMKESYLKSIGKGITEDLRKITFEEIGHNVATRQGRYIYTFNYDKFILSVCSEENKENIIKHILLDDLYKELIDK